MEHHGTVWFLLSYTLSDEGCSCLWQPRYGPFWIFHISQWKCQRGIPDLERKRGLKLQLPSDLFNFPLRISVYLHFFYKAGSEQPNKSNRLECIYIYHYTLNKVQAFKEEKTCAVPSQLGVGNDGNGLRQCRSSVYPERRPDAPRARRRGCAPCTPTLLTFLDICHMG